MYICFVRALFFSLYVLYERYSYRYNLVVIGCCCNSLPCVCSVEAGHVPEAESLQRCGSATSTSPRLVCRLAETRQSSVQRGIRLHGEEGPRSHATLHRQKHNGGTAGKVNVVGVKV